MTDTPSESGLPGLYAIDQRSAPLWLAMLCRVVLLFVRPGMERMMAAGRIANTAWIGNAADASLDDGIHSAMRHCSMQKAWLASAAALAGLNAIGLKIAGFVFSGPNENGSIACSNRPIPETGCGDRI